MMILLILDQLLNHYLKFHSRGAQQLKDRALGHPFRVHHTSLRSGGALPAYPAVTERRRLQRLNTLGATNGHASNY